MNYPSLFIENKKLSKLNTFNKTYKNPHADSNHKYSIISDKEIELKNKSNYLIELDNKSNNQGEMTGNSSSSNNLFNDNKIKKIEVKNNSQIKTTIINIGTNDPIVTSSPQVNNNKITNFSNSLKKNILSKSKEIESVIKKRVNKISTGNKSYNNLTNHVNNETINSQNYLSTNPGNNNKSPIRNNFNTSTKKTIATLNRSKSKSQSKDRISNTNYHKKQNTRQIPAYIDKILNFSSKSKFSNTAKNFNKTASTTNNIAIVQSKK